MTSRSRWVTLHERPISYRQKRSPHVDFTNSKQPEQGENEKCVQ